MEDIYRERQKVILFVFVLAASLLALKAMQLQIFDKTFRSKASATAIDEEVVYPSRGLIYDRNDKLLVYNQPIYDLMVIYNQLDTEMDTMKFCRLLNISKEYFIKTLDKNWRSPLYSKSVPFVFFNKISPELFASFQESLYEFPGFFPFLRNVRGYPHRSSMHVLGAIREVNKEEVKDSTRQYDPGDYIGDSGLEKYYESKLKGEKGFQYILKDNLGREVGSFEGGNADKSAVAGHDLKSTIDLDLQEYGESLMQNKIGSIVAIEPETGEILAMISSPTIDPNKLTIGRNRGKAYAALSVDPTMPFFDRSIMAQYPPGSLFKPVVALIGLQEKVWEVNKRVYCPGGFYFKGQELMNCHGHLTCTNVSSAIQYSCNAYFATMFRSIVDKNGIYNPDEGLDVFNKYLIDFGFGSPLGIDLPREKSGNFPSSKYYNNKFKNEQQWYSLWILSLGIGQGELLMTNLQMANLAAILANRGFFVTPHLIKEIRNVQGEKIEAEAFNEKKQVGINKEHFEPVVDGMEKVVNSGTARMAFIAGIPVCGKTGTAENNQNNGKDHSIFFGFAPKDKPKIAIAVYIENGGWGGSYAAPIASLMIEKHLKGSIHANRKYLEKRMMEAVFIENKIATNE